MPLNPAEQSFAVHLESLLGFAQELETQIHGVTKPSGQLETLLSTPILLGAFNEADSLADSHATAVAEMHTLLADVREALAFANDVTKTVAQGYSKLDADLGAYIISTGVLSDDPGANPAGTHAGDNQVSVGSGGVEASAGPGGASAVAPGVTAAATPTNTTVTVGDVTVSAGTDGSVHVDTGAAPAPAVDVPAASVPNPTPAPADPSVASGVSGQQLPGFERGVYRFTDPSGSEV